MARRIDKAAVIGSGIMGGGIAALLADAGIETLLLDIVPFDLKDEEKNDPAARNRIVQAGFNGLKKARPAAFMDKGSAIRISLGNLEDDLDKLKECDLIVEVVVENLKIKQELFAKIDKVRSADTIIASNTSGLPLKEMVSGTSKAFQEHFCITHFFNPVRYMHLLELVAGPDTKQEILDFVADFGEKRLGKGIVWAKDTPNFIGNRIGVGDIVQAFKFMESEGMSIPEVDAVMGPAMGRPKTAMFKLSDMVGLDTTHHLAGNSYELLKDDEMRENYILPEYYNKMVENKWLGDKTKQGFYKKGRTPEGKRFTQVIDPKTLEYVDFDKKFDFPCLAASKAAKTPGDKINAVVYGDDKAAKFAWKMTAAGCIYAANRVPEISDTIVEIDNAMTWGYNMALGPFQIWDAIGVKKSIEKMEKDGFTIPENVKKMVASGATSFYKTENGKDMYYDLVGGGYKEIKQNPLALNLAAFKSDGKEVLGNASVSLIDLGDGVFNCEYHTKMNALNGEIIDSFFEFVDYVKTNGVGLVIGNQAPGMPGAFSAGADLAFMLGLAKAGKFTDIDKFIANSHKAISGLTYSPFPVVAAPYGMTLGGGCEGCLAADRILAHAETYMGLVEIGAGLLPGGLGMLNLWKRFIHSAPASVKIGDYAAYFLPAFMTVATAKVGMSAAEAKLNGFLRPTDRIIFNKDLLIGEAKKEVLRMVEDGYSPPAKALIPVMGREAQGMVSAEMLNMRGGNYITPHMEYLSKTIAFIMSGGDVIQGSKISEDQWMKTEREAFVELWKTENSQKMAEHMLTTGKPLMI